MKKNKHILILLAALMSLSLGRAYAQMPATYAQGKSLYREGKLEEATTYFYKALFELNAGKSKNRYAVDSEKVILDYLNLCYTDSREKNIPFKNLEFDSSTTEEFLFSITDVQSLNDDSAIVTINQGRQNGIYTGAVAHVMATHAAGRDDDRAMKYLGAATITELSDFSCTAVVHFFKKMKGAKVYPKDMLEIAVYPIRNSKKSMLYEMRKLNVVFKDNSKNEVFDERGFFYNTSPFLMGIIMDAYAKELRDFAPDLDGLDDERFSTKYKNGPFRGRTMREIFHTTSVHDVYAFFNFVKSYPGKYIGTPWKINETYATWLLNDAPTGEKDREWLIEAVEGTSMSNMDKLLEDVGNFIASDSLSTWDEKIRAYLEDGNTEAATALTDKTLYIAEYLDSKADIAAMLYRKAYLKKAANDHKGALAEMLKAYNYFPESDGYAWNAAIMYADAERYDSAFLLFDMLTKKYPENWEIKGNYGWYKTLAGKFDDAAPLCKYAYDNNPYSVSCAVNYGHVFLLQGNLDSAKRYYNIMLSNLTKPEEYTEGPKKDFEIFFAKGWQRKIVADLAEWLDSEFKKKYIFTTTGNKFYNEGKKLYKERKYNKAIQLFNEYANTISQASEPNMADIYIADMYLGHCYNLLGKRDSTIKYYMLCLQIAKTYLANNRGKQPDEDHIASSYDRLYDYYQDTLKDLQTAYAYKMLYNAEVQKLSDINNTTHLHVICLGGRDTLAGEQFEANARIFYDSIVALGNKSDTVGKHIYLSGKSMTKKMLLEKLAEVRQVSTPEDIFIFYYSGHAVTVDDKDVLYFNLADSENGNIDARELLQNFDLIYAKKKMLITDGPEPQLFSLISSQFTTATASTNEIIFLCPAIKTPLDTDGHSIFTAELVKGLTDLKKKDKFSAREFVDHASYALGRGQHYLPVLSFSYGRDFTLYKSDSIAVVENTMNRGLTINTGNDDAAAGTHSTGGSQRNYALFFASDVYDDNNTWHALSNPISDASALGTLLQDDFGFEVEVVRNASKKEIENKLREYRTRNYGPNDQLMIFFAGHGIYYPDANMGYLVAKDSKDPIKADPNFNTYMSYSDLGNLYLKNMKCRRIFLVLDACYAGSFFEEKGYRRGGPDMPGNDKSIQQRLSMLKKNASGKTFYKGISSGGKETVEDGRKDQHSPFASGLIAMLNSAIANQYITADAIIGEIQNYHPGNTTPSSGTFNYSDPQGLFIFEAKIDQKEATANNSKTLIKTDHLKR